MTVSSNFLSSKRHMKYKSVLFPNPYKKKLNFYGSAGFLTGYEVGEEFNKYFFKVSR